MGAALLLVAAGPSPALGPPDDDGTLRLVPWHLVEAPGEPVSLGPSFEARFLAPTVPLRIGPRPGQTLYYHDPTFGPLHYSTPMRVARNDLVLHFEAPGEGIALVEFEIEFY